MGGGSIVVLEKGEGDRERKKREGREVSGDCYVDNGN